MGVIDNLGYIKKAQHFPCASPNPLLVLEAAGKAITPVLLNAATFGCNDIVKMRAGISPWHARGMRALIEGAIPPDEKSAAGKLLKFTIPLEKALFFWFVVDLTVDFFARWQSQIFRLGACGNNLSERTASGPLRTFVEPFPNHWQFIAYTFTQPQGQFAGPIGFTVPRGWYWSAYFSLTVKPLFTGQVVGSVQTRLRNVATGPFSLEGEPATPDWFGNPTHTAMKFENVAPRGRLLEFRFEAQADNVAIGSGGSAVVSISNQPLLNNSIFPVNCFGKFAPGVNPIL
jgi:hypothetical protein